MVARLIDNWMLSFSSIDLQVLNAFNGLLPGYTWFFYIVTQLGSPLSLSIFALLAFLTGKKKWKTFAAVLVIGLIFSMLVIDDVKDIVKRPRPDIVRMAPYLTKNTYSFPSGHALSIFLAASILGAYFGWRYYIVGYLIGIAVSLSRLYLGVHYPSDILAGAILGIIMGEMLVFAAYRLGLCDNYGLLSHRKKTHGTAKQAFIWSHGPEKAISITAFLVTLATLALFYLGQVMWSVFLIAVASLLIILLVMRSGKKHDELIYNAFAIMAIGLISAISLYYVNELGLSLAAIALAYAATVGLTLVKTKKNGCVE